MPQPAPGTRPSPPERPDPEAELLRALSRRDSSSCRHLLLHLVHRRGVGALDGLRRRSLALEPDQQGWIWLSQLLTSEPGLEVASPLVSSAAPPTSLVASEVAAGPAPSVPTPPAAEQDRFAAPSRDQVSGLDLDRRAEVAVDEAFEALAAAFPAAAPQAVPASGWAELEDPQRGSVVSPSGLEEPPFTALFRSSPLVSPLATASRGLFSFVIPRPLDQDLDLNGTELGQSGIPAASPSEGQGAGQPAAVPQAMVEGEPAAPESDQVSSLWSRAEGRVSGLRDRVRGRLSMGRFRSLVRDCVGEAYASLQGAEPGIERQPPVSGDQLDPFELEVVSGTITATDPVDSFWSLEQPLSPRQVPAGLPGHQAPVAAFGPALAGAGDARPQRAAADQSPVRLSATEQLRQRLMNRNRRETRPAPAPQALVALRAWLPVDDLPRAS